MSCKGQENPLWSILAKSKLKNLSYTHREIKKRPSNTHNMLKLSVSSLPSLPLPHFIHSNKREREGKKTEKIHSNTHNSAYRMTNIRIHIFRFMPNQRANMAEIRQNDTRFSVLLFPPVEKKRWDICGIRRFV